jgi:hypothetical protein
MFLEAGRDPEKLRVMAEHFHPWVEKRLNDGRYYGFALCDTDQVVAAIGLMTIDWPPHPSHPTMDQRGYVLNVFVEPTHRRNLMPAASQCANLRAWLAKQCFQIRIMNLKRLLRRYGSCTGEVVTAPWFSNKST